MVCPRRAAAPPAVAPRRSLRPGVPRDTSLSSSAARDICVTAASACRPRSTVLHAFLTAPDVGNGRRALYFSRLPEHHARVIVALDGPAGSGKSTTARRVADRLGWLYLDTGAMYRAVGLAFGDQSLPFTDAAAAALLPGLTIGLVPDTDGVRVSLGGEDVTARIRTPEAAEAASHVSALGPVRTAMVAQQRAVAHAHEATGRGVVVEGRDIGTVVFPEAAVKFFLVADLEARARRRLDDLAAASARTGTPVPAFEAVRSEIAARDDRDRSRDLAPLHAAPDAVLLDTTALSVDEQVETVVQAVLAAADPA